MERTIFIHALVWLKEQHPQADFTNLTDGHVKIAMDMEYPTGWEGFIEDLAVAGGVS